MKGTDPVSAQPNPTASRSASTTRRAEIHFEPRAPQSRRRPARPAASGHGVRWTSTSTTATSAPSPASTSTFGHNEITALIGPSGCGKSTLLRSLNRMNDLVLGARVDGQVTFHGEDIYAKDVDAIEVRRRIGMVFQKPNPFPKSIYDNVAYGPRVIGMKVSRWTTGRAGTDPGGAVGRGQGQAQAVRLRAVRRPAAAALHRPHHRGQAGGDLDGRALLGARPDRHGAHRGPDGGAG